MTARSLHEIISGKASQYGISHNRVRRDSLPKGSCEARFWRPVSKRQMGAAMIAAESYGDHLTRPLVVDHYQDVGEFTVLGISRHGAGEGDLG